MDHANPGFHTFWQANRERLRGRAPRGYRSRFRGRNHRHRPRRFRSQVFRKKGRQSRPTDGGPRQRQRFRRWQIHERSRGNVQQHRPQGQENRAQLENREPGFEGRLEPSSGPNSSMGSLWLQRSTSHPVCPPAPQHEPQYLNDTTGNWRFDRPSPSVNGGVGSACGGEDTCGPSGLSYRHPDHSMRRPPIAQGHNPCPPGQTNTFPTGKFDNMTRLFGPPLSPFDQLVESARTRIPDDLPLIAKEKIRHQTNIINNLQMENQDLHLRVRELEAHLASVDPETMCSQMDEHLPDAVADDASHV